MYPFTIDYSHKFPTPLGDSSQCKRRRHDEESASLTMKVQLKNKVIKFREDARDGIEVALLEVDEWRYKSAKFFLSQDSLYIKDADDCCHNFSTTEVQAVYNFWEASTLWDQLNYSVSPGDRTRAIIVVCCQKNGLQQTICLLESNKAAQEEFIVSLKILLEWQTKELKKKFGHVQSLPENFVSKDPKVDDHHCEALPLNNSRSVHHVQYDLPENFVSKDPEIPDDPDPILIPLPIPPSMHLPTKELSNLLNQEVNQEFPISSPKMAEKEKQRTELKELLTKFVASIGEGLKCTRLHTVDGVLNSEQVQLSLDDQMQSLSLSFVPGSKRRRNRDSEKAEKGEERDYSWSAPLSDCQIRGCCKPGELRPGYVSSTVVKGYEVSRCVIISHEDEVVHLLAEDEDAESMIVKCLQILQARAKHRFGTSQTDNSSTSYRTSSL
jgi:hypothetical protein